MSHSQISSQEIDRRGYEWYEQHIRKQVETQENLGKIVVIDVETGSYEIDSNARTATSRAFARNLDAALLALRIGYDAVGSFGGGLQRTK